MAHRQKIRRQISAFFNKLKRAKIDWAESREIGKKWEELSKIEKHIISIIEMVFNRLIKGLQLFFSYLAQSTLLSFVIFLLLFFLCVTLLAILPSEHFFEGNLTVEEMSFTYAGQEQKLFLDTIRRIKSLGIKGKQTLSFTGKFQSQSMPELNQLETLNIELTTDDESNLLIESSQKEIELTELRVQPNTQVDELNYDTYSNKLAFSLSKIQDKPDKANILKLNLGGLPLTVTLEGYYKLDNKSGSQEKRQLEFNVTPNNQEFMLNLANPVTLTLETPVLTNNEAKQWFRGKIDVKDVKFQRLDETGVNQIDSLSISTILEGKVRMAEQEREIKENQFLMAGEPGIELIRYLNIVPKKGLEVRISGQSKLIQLGLDRQFPVSRIQASWLDGILPRDAIIALIAFCAASFSYLLYFIIDYIAKSSTKP